MTSISSLRQAAPGARFDQGAAPSRVGMQFTPNIALGDSGLLLDVGASLRLFGGPALLTHLARACLAQLGVQAAIGVAPT